jgi:hypothetical protein
MRSMWILLLMLISFSVYGEEQEERTLVFALDGEYRTLRSPLIIWEGELVFATTSHLPSRSDIIRIEERIYWHRYDFETGQLETGDSSAPFLLEQAVDEETLISLNVDWLSDSLHDMVSLSPDDRYLLYKEATTQSFWLMDFETNNAINLDVVFRLRPTSEEHGKLFYLDAHWDLEREWVYFQRYTPIDYAVTIPATRVSLETGEIEELHRIPAYQEAFTPAVTRTELIALHPEDGHLLVFADYPVGDYWLYNMTTETFTYFERPRTIAAIWLDENTLRLTAGAGVMDYDIVTDTATMVRPIEMTWPERFAQRAVFSEDGRYLAVVNLSAPELEGEAGIFVYELPIGE